MSQRKTGRHAVLLCQVPADWRPTHYGTHPSSILAAEWLGKKLHLHQAEAVVRLHNTRRLQSPDGSWLLLVIHPRSCQRYIGRVVAKGVRS